MALNYHKFWKNKWAENCYRVKNSENEHGSNAPNNKTVIAG